MSLEQRSTHYTHQPHNKQLFRRTADTAALGVKSKSITSQKTTVISAVVARRDKAEEAGSSLRGDLVVIEWHWHADDDLKNDRATRRQSMRSEQWRLASLQQLNLETRSQSLLTRGALICWCLLMSACCAREMRRTLQVTAARQANNEVRIDRNIRVGRVSLRASQRIAMNSLKPQWCSLSSPAERLCLLTKWQLNETWHVTRDRWWRQKRNRCTHVTQRVFQSRSIFVDLANKHDRIVE